MPVHSLLSTGEYKITSDSGIEIDADTSMVTRRLSAVYRGSLSSLFSTFQFGTQDQVPESQVRMFCSGPRNVQQVEGTYSNPHWSFDVEWVGLHSYVHGSAYSVFRVTPLWSVRETSFPIEYTYGSSTYSINGTAITNALPSGESAEKPVVIHDYVPGLSVRGIMHTNIVPNPAHPLLTTLKNEFNTIITPNMISANMTNYPAGTGYNFTKGMPVGSTTSAASVGIWLIGDIQATRLYEPMNGLTSSKIYDVQFAVRWLPRKTLS